MYQKYFCTFADSRMKKSLERVEKQILDANFFDEVLINNESNLDPIFKEKFKNKLIKGTRGYGYFVWKPQIILQTLERMQDGDVLLYMDVGCHFNKEGIPRLEYYIKKTLESASGIFCFKENIEVEDPTLEDTNPPILERNFTKGDLFEYFKVTENKEVYNTGQIAATAFLIKKCEQSQLIVNSWIKVFEDNFDLINDSPSKSPNFPDFIENRADQSVLSILCKLNGASTISAKEIWQSDWSKLKKYPIHAKRDKHLNIFWKIVRKLISGGRY